MLRGICPDSSLVNIINGSNSVQIKIGEHCPGNEPGAETTSRRNLKVAKRGNRLNRNQLV